MVVIASMTIVILEIQERKDKEGSLLVSVVVKRMSLVILMIMLVQLNSGNALGIGAMPVLMVIVIVQRVVGLRIVNQLNTT